MVKFIRKTNKKNKLPIKRGFTLIEVIVAMFIFVLIMTSATAIFARIFKSYKEIKNINENVKNAQFAMNLMSKTFRTSSIKYPGSDFSSTDTLVVYDYSQSICIRYRFSGNELRKSTSVAVESDCDDTPSPAFSTAIPITIGTVNGFFSGEVSSGFDSVDTPDTSGNVGKVTIMMNIVSGSGSESKSARLQTTVALRDYDKSNVGIDKNR